MIKRQSKRSIRHNSYSDASTRDGSGTRICEWTVESDNAREVYGTKTGVGTGVSFGIEKIRLNLKDDLFLVYLHVRSGFVTCCLWCHQRDGALLNEDLDVLLFEEVQKLCEILRLFFCHCWNVSAENEGSEVDCIGFILDFLSMGW